jgi:hypothetical protein
MNPQDNDDIEMQINLLIDKFQKNKFMSLEQINFIVQEIDKLEEQKKK